MSASPRQLVRYMPLVHTFYNVRLSLNTSQRRCHISPYFFQKKIVHTLVLLKTCLHGQCNNKNLSRPKIIILLTKYQWSIGCISVVVNIPTNTISWSVARQVGWLSVDYCSTYRPTNVGWESDWESVDMLIEYQPIVLTDILLRGVQISQDPLLQLVAYENFRNSSIIHKEKNKRN